MPGPEPRGMGMRPHVPQAAPSPWLSFAGTDAKTGLFLGDVGLLRRQLWPEEDLPLPFLLSFPGVNQHLHLWVPPASYISLPLVLCRRFLQDSLALGISSWYLCLRGPKLGFPGGSVVKNSPANAGDAGSIPGLGRCPGEGNGTPLQCYCQENLMHRRAWRATVQESQRAGHNRAYTYMWPQVNTPAASINCQECCTRPQCSVPRGHGQSFFSIGG